MPDRAQLNSCPTGRRRAQVYYTTPDWYFDHGKTLTDGSWEFDYAIDPTANSTLVSSQPCNLPLPFAKGLSLPVSFSLCRLWSVRNSATPFSAFRCVSLLCRLRGISLQVRNSATFLCLSMRLLVPVPIARNLSAIRSLTELIAGRSNAGQGGLG